MGWERGRRGGREGDGVGEGARGWERGRGGGRGGEGVGEGAMGVGERAMGWERCTATSLLDGEMDS